MIEIGDEYMIADIDGQMVATARWSWHAAADDNGAWIASTHPKRPFARHKANSAMVLASLLARLGQPLANTASPCRRGS